METNTTPNVHKPSNFFSSDFLSFKTMITLNIIQVIYVVVAVIITIGGLFTMFGGNSRAYGDFMPGGFIGGALIIVFGNILWRIWCELIIVFFRINKSLSNIDDKTKA